MLLFSTQSFLSTAAWLPALHNSYQLLTPATIPVFIVGYRLAMAIGYSYYTIFFFPYFDPRRKAQKSKPIPSDSKDLNGNVISNVQKADDMEELLGGRFAMGRALSAFSQALISNLFFLLVSRLALALYVINYIFIRYDFFTTPVPFNATPFGMVRIANYYYC